MVRDTLCWRIGDGGWGITLNSTPANLSTACAARQLGSLDGSPNAGLCWYSVGTVESGSRLLISHTISTLDAGTAIPPSIPPGTPAPPSPRSASLSAVLAGCGTAAAAGAAAADGDPSADHDDAGCGDGAPAAVAAAAAGGGGVGVGEMGSGVSTTTGESTARSDAVLVLPPDRAGPASPPPMLSPPSG